MIFASLALLIPTIWFLPWWALAPLATFAGYMNDGRSMRALQFSFSAGLVWCAMAFLKDGQNAGIISSRIAKMFSAPFSGFAFILVFAIGFLTALLFFQAGNVAARMRAN